MMSGVIKRLLIQFFFVCFLTTFSHTLTAAPYVEGELLIKTKSPIDLTQQGQLKTDSTAPASSLNQTLSKYKLKGIQMKRSFGQSRRFSPLNAAPQTQRASENTGNLYHIQLETPSDNLKEIIQDIKKDPNVDYVQPNYLFESTETSPTPNDTLFSNNQPNLKALDLPKAWTITSGNSDIVIAIIDTGVSYTHSDLSANIWINPTENSGTASADDDSNGRIDDIRGWDFVSVNVSASKRVAGEDYTVEDNDPNDKQGHGTHVAGIASAHTNNSTGIAGVSYNHAKIMALRAGYAIKSGSSNSGEFTTASLVDAIDYAISMNAHIINMSLGGHDDVENPNNAFKNAVKRAIDAGILVVASAGNNSRNIDSSSFGPYIPASYPDVLTVSATDNDGELADFSNFGDSVDVSAPGVDIYSTYKSNSYDKKSGTSMSAPHIAGLAALIMSQDISPTPTATVAAEMIKRGVSPNARAAAKSPEYGYGNANAVTALGLEFPSLLSSFDTIIAFGPEGLLKPILNHPNPFDPSSTSTDIYYSLTGQADVSMKIYSLSLQKVKEITKSGQAAGKYTETWDGRDGTGSIVPNGVYVMVFEATSSSKGTERQIHKIAVIQ